MMYFAVVAMMTSTNCVPCVSIIVRGLQVKLRVT